MELHNRVAVITGGASGIGRALAERFQLKARVLSDLGAGPAGKLEVWLAPKRRGQR